MSSQPRIAFVLDALPSLGGGEKVLFTALEIFPCADIFTLVYNEPVFVNSPIANKKINTSFINSMPFAQRHHRMFLPLMPRAIEQFDLCNYDVVVSFNYAVANGVQTNGAKHVSYTYTPMRYAWQHIGLNGKISHNNPLIEWYMRLFRHWDKNAAARVHEFAAISHGIAQRIQSAYQRESRVIYPPVETARFQARAPRGDFYVTLSRLVPHKRLDVVVEAFADLQLPLKVIGDGPERKRLEKLAGGNIEFLGFQSEARVAELLEHARGFICAAEEDFGIAIVEAQAAGCPVIAYGRGGALETVVDGKTGLFFEEQSAGSLIEAVQKFERMYNDFRVETSVQNAQRFNLSRFKTEFGQFVVSDF